jgi:hypothetical protein
MSFQGYLNSIEKSTGKTPADFRGWAEDREFLNEGRLRSDVKVTEVVDALKQDFGLGRGHAMAIVALLKGTKNEGDA